MPYLYNERNAKAVKQNMDKIMRDAEIQKVNTLEPTMDEYRQVITVVKEYIKNKKRKVYGGMAYQTLITHKNPSDGFYNPEVDKADYEIYSPEPIKDLIELCNILHDKGFKSVRGSHAQHPETYKIFVNFDSECIDISYCPNMIFGFIPVKEVDGIQICAPKFLYIDMFRIFNDPMTSSRRYEKTFKRGYLLQKHYPLHDYHGKVKQVGLLEKNESELGEIRRFIEQEFLPNRGTVMSCGAFAYNYYVRESGSTKVKPVNVAEYHLISIDYKADVLELCRLLQEKYPEKIAKDEYYPFYQFTDNKSVIKYQDQPIVTIYGHNEKCIPYLTHENIQLVTYPYVLMMLLINEFKTKVDRDKKRRHNYQVMLTNLVQARNFFLQRSNKTILDNTPFREFRLSCSGKTIDERRKSKLDRAMKIQRSPPFSYNPGKNRMDPEKVHRSFRNTSGRIINNKKNLRCPLEDEIEEEPEEVIEEVIADVEEDDSSDQA